MVIKVGDYIPDGTFRVMGPMGPETVNVDKLFNDRSVVLFSVPGAFTPKSTYQHVPSYLENTEAFRALGIDSILCVSPNDAHVMQAWGEHCSVNSRIIMLADNHAEFFSTIGLEMDCTRFGLGYRCQRFSLIAKNRLITHLNIEEPGGYAVSNAETILAQLQVPAEAEKGKELA